VDVQPPRLFETDEPVGGEGGGVATVQRTRPTSAVTLATVLLPVVLMPAKAPADILLPKGAPKSVLDIIGTPLIALLIAVVVGMCTFGRGPRLGLKDVAKTIEQSLRRSRASCSSSPRAAGSSRSWWTPRSTI
jgi:gluconate:H+ symporter, GntP family